MCSVLSTSSYAAGYCYSWDCYSGSKSSHGEQTETKKNKYDDKSKGNTYGTESYKLRYGDDIYKSKPESSSSSNKNKRSKHKGRRN